MRTAVITAATVLLVSAVPAKAHAPTRWDCLAHWESTHRWHYNGLHDGGLQFSPSTWRAYTGSSAPRYAWQASREFQIKVGKRVAWYGFYRHEPQGPGAWPNTWHRCF
jgi:hypothetical protein